MKQGTEAQSPNAQTRRRTPTPSDDHLESPERAGGTLPRESFSTDSLEAYPILLADRCPAVFITSWAQGPGQRI